MAGLSDQAATEVTAALCLHPLGGDPSDVVHVVVPPERMHVLAAFATMTTAAFDLVLKQAQMNPMPIGETTEHDRLTLGVFYHTAGEYFVR